MAAPVNPGDRLTWEHDGDRRDGVVWSSAPGVGTRWVVPDDRPDTAVLVKVRNGHVEQTQDDDGWRPIAVAAARIHAGARLVICGGWTTTWHVDGCPRVGDDARPPFWGQTLALRDLVRGEVEATLCTCLIGREVSS